MPRKGFKAVTLKENLYKKIEEIAKSENRSIASIVTEAIQRFIETHVYGDLPTIET